MVDEIYLELQRYLGSLTADYWALHLQMENLMEIQHKFCAREEIERESGY